MDVKDMTDRHLANTIKFVESRLMEETDADYFAIYPLVDAIQERVDSDYREHEEFIEFMEAKLKMLKKEVIRRLKSQSKILFTTKKHD